MKRKPLVLTVRDHELLVDLYKHRFLSISQVQQLYFPSLQTAYRRMRILRESSLVSAFSVAGIDESIFSIASRGLQSVAEAIGVDRAQLKWKETSTKPKDYYFMKHFLAINDFRIILTQACKKSDIKLLGFIPDYYGEQSNGSNLSKYIKDIILDISNTNSPISHTPDGVFALERNGKAALFFLEIDRGTEVISDPSKGVLKSIRFYSNYLLDGKYQRYAKDFGVSEFRGFRALYITLSGSRLDNMRESASSLNLQEKVLRFFWIATLDKCLIAMVCTPIWKSMDIADDSLYQID